MNAIAMESARIHRDETEVWLQMIRRITVYILIAITAFATGWAAGFVMAMPQKGTKIVIASYVGQDQSNAIVYGRYGGFLSGWEGWNYRFAYMPPGGSLWREYYFAHEEPFTWSDVEIRNESGSLSVYRRGDRIGTYYPYSAEFHNLLQNHRHTKPLQDNAHALFGG